MSGFLNTIQPTDYSSGGIWSNLKHQWKHGSWYVESYMGLRRVSGSFAPNWHETKMFLIILIIIITIIITIIIMHQRFPFRFYFLEGWGFPMIPVDTPKTKTWNWSNVGEQKGYWVWTPSKPFRHPSNCSLTRSPVWEKFESHKVANKRSRYRNISAQSPLQSVSHWNHFKPSFSW